MLRDVPLAEDLTQEFFAGFLRRGFLDGVAPMPAPVAPLFDARDAWERGYILSALTACDGNISRTAEALGIERSNLYRKMRAFGIMPSRKAEEEDPV